MENNYTAGIPTLAATGYQNATQFDCTMIPAKAFREQIGGAYKLPVCLIFGTGFFCSSFVAYFLLKDERNRDRYPLRFIAFACLTQAAYAQRVVFSIYLD